jgi:hypothetical protein
MRSVFLATMVIMFCGAAYNWVVSRRVELVEAAGE